jgi:hypothetical protein
LGVLGQPRGDCPYKSNAKTSNLKPKYKKYIIYCSPISTYLYIPMILPVSP